MKIQITGNGGVEISGDIAGDFTYTGSTTTTNDDQGANVHYGSGDNVGSGPSVHYGSGDNVSR